MSFEPVIKISRSQITQVVTGCVGTGVSASTWFTQDTGPLGGGALIVQAVMTGSFSALTFNLEASLNEGVTWGVVSTWSSTATPIDVLQISERALFRFNCTSFTGGTSVDLFAIVAEIGSINVSGGSGPSTNVNASQQGVWNVGVTDNGNTANVDSNNSLQVALYPGTPLPAGTNVIGQVEITDGTHGPVTVGVIGSTKALAVEIVDGSGNQIANFSDVSIVQGGHTGVVTVSGAIKVDGSSVTQPTEDAATGIVNNTAPSDAIQIGSVDGSGNLQAASATHPIPVTVGSPSLPTYSVSTGATLKTVSTIAPVLTIQPQSGTQANTFTLQSIDLMGLSVAYYEIRRNATLTGASFSAVNGSSLMNYDTSASSASGGLVVDSGFVMVGSHIKEFSTITFSFTGSTGDKFTLLFAGANSNTASVGGSFSWTE
jgi:hypothetical protein